MNESLPRPSAGGFRDWNENQPGFIHACFPAFRAFQGAYLALGAYLAFGAYLTFGTYLALSALAHI